MIASVEVEMETPKSTRGDATAQPGPTKAVEKLGR